MTRLLAGRAFRMLLGLLLLIQAIFMAESFTILMEAVVGNGGSALDLLLLLLLETPEIVDFALPLVLLVGLFFAIVTARNENELVVCAAAGVPWTRVPRLAFIAGIIAFFVSLLFSGILTPLTSYTQRLAIQQLEARAAIRQITEPDKKATIRDLQGRTIIASASESPDVERGNLFIYHPDEGEGWRVSQADDWAIVGPDDTDGYSVRLKAFRDYTGNVAPEDRQDAEDSGASLGSSLQFATISVKTLALDFRLEQVVQAADRERRASERTLFNIGGGVAARPAVINRHLGELLARALLSLFAAMMAVAAAAWAGTRTGRYAALPLAAVLVMLGDVVSRTVLGDAAALAPAGFWAMVGLVGATGVALPMVYVLIRGEMLIAPGRDG